MPGPRRTRFSGSGSPMRDASGSGTGPEPVIALPADGEGALRRLVAALDTVVGAGLPPHALVGGLAVIANLAQAHRVTADVDTVSDDDVGGIEHTVTLLVSARKATRKPSGDGVVLRDGTAGPGASTPGSPPPPSPPRISRWSAHLLPSGSGGRHEPSRHPESRTSRRAGSRAAR